MDRSATGVNNHASKGGLKNGKKHWTDGWTIEFCAALLSVLSLAALIILLAALDGRPSFDWNGVTINALVELLSTVSRGSLMAALAEALSQCKWMLFKQSRRRLYDLELVELASRNALSRLKILWRMPLGLVTVNHQQRLEN
jgi:hypothetical protein